MTSALLFPGQGAQQPGMLDFVLDDPTLHPMAEDLYHVTGLTLAQLQTPDALNHGKQIQLALFVAGVASFRQLHLAGAAFDFVAGFSIGTFSAAVASGAYTFRNLLPVVALRGELMDAAYPSSYGMLAVISPRVREISLVVHHDPALEKRAYLANTNSANQIVFSGERSALDRIAHYAQQLGAVAIHYLKTPAPSHCALMAGVSRQLNASLLNVPSTSPDMPYLSNLTTRLVKDQALIQLDLANNVANPIDWHSGTELLIENGVDIFVEAFPSDTLTRLGEQGAPKSVIRWVSLAQKGVVSAAKLLSFQR